METTDDFRALMEEPAHGHNEGRGTPDENGRQPLSPKEWQAQEFLKEGGFGAVDTTAGTHTGKTYGYQDAGMHSHRGTLHIGEYVHHDELIAGVERHLGFSFDEVRSVYTRSGGPLPSSLRDLRARIDARLLELHSIGHINLVEFARVMGLTEMAMHRALGRARKAEQDKMVRP